MKLWKHINTFDTVAHYIYRLV